jgi:hypothetical protein
MRKYRYLALATGAALLVSVPAGAALATNTHKAAKPVLTIGKVKGPAVKKGAVLKAGLPKKGSVTFTIGGTKVTCTSSSIAAKVLKNPAKAGEATMSVTSVKVAKCSKVLGLSLSLSALNLPYNSTIKTSKGNPVTISGTKKSKPTGFKVTAGSGSSAVVCVFTASAFTGHASNKNNTVSFSKQKLTLDKAASNGLCSTLGTSATVTATYGPIVDSSVKHSPKVFVS